MDNEELNPEMDETSDETDLGEETQEQTDDSSESVDEIKAKYEAEIEKRKKRAKQGYKKSQDLKKPVEDLDQVIEAKVNAKIQEKERLSDFLKRNPNGDPKKVEEIMTSKNLSREDAYKLYSFDNIQSNQGQVFGQFRQQVTSEKNPFEIDYNPNKGLRK